MTGLHIDLELPKRPLCSKNMGVLYMLWRYFCGPTLFLYFDSYNNHLRITRNASQREKLNERKSSKTNVSAEKTENNRFPDAFSRKNHVI